MVSLVVGPQETHFSVHSTILEQSAVLAAKVEHSSMEHQQVLASELDKPTAHTLIHYMYTGNYQDLGATSRAEHSAVSSYETATCVYCAAVLYQLSGLADLAKEKITSLEKEVSMSDMLRMAKNHAFPLLPENETWYLAYLEGAIRNAMAKDPEPFKRPDFITQVEGSSRLLQLVWKTVISNYNGTVVTPKAENDDAISKVEEHQKSENIASFEHQPPASVDGSQTTAVAHDTPADPPSPQPRDSTYIATGDPLEDTLKLDDIEPFTDELGFEKSKMYQRMNKIESGSESPVIPASELYQAAHKRSDSVMQAEEDATTVLVTTPVEEAEEAGNFGGASPLRDDGLIDAATTTKKSKKKKKGKSSIVF